MNKLTPAPDNDRPKKTWEDLDDELQRCFGSSVRGANIVYGFHFDDYDIPKDEFKSELLKAGYQFVEFDNKLHVSLKKD